MSGGGGGGGPQPQDNSLQIAQMNLNKQREDEAKQAADLERRTNEFSTNKLTSRSTAEEDAAAELQRRGLDYTKYIPIVQRGLNTAMNRIPNLDPNPAQYFTPDVLNGILTGEENAQRSRNTGVVNQAFTPGFDRALLGDTADDSYINDILSGQKAEANKTLDYSKSRGQLNDFGYSGALTKLGEQETGARSTLDTLGQSVLGKDRAGLQGMRDKALSGANSYTLGGPDFSIDPYRGELNDAVANYSKNLGGDITNALGGTKLFNVNDILLSGSRQQGPQNLTTAAGAPIVPKKQSTIDRGAGSGGQF